MSITSFLGLISLLALIFPVLASAQSMGASNGFQIRSEVGRAINSTQLYIRQRGVGWSNLNNNIRFSSISVSGSSASGLIDLPVPSVIGPLPEEFRLSITNTDQIQNTLTTSNSSLTSVTLTSAPIASPLR